MPTSYDCLNGTSLVLFLLLLSSSTLRASDPIMPPPGGVDAIAFDQNVTLQSSAKHTSAQGEWVAVDGMPFENVYRVNLATRPEITEHAELKVPVKDAIVKGSTMLLSFWIRRPKSGGEPGPSVVSLHSDSKKPGYEYKFSAYRDWQQHVRPFVASADIDTGQATVTFHVGNSGAAVEVGDLRLVTYGTSLDVQSLPKSAVTYQGRDPDAQWRKDALARIQQIRKGDLTVEVVDASGHPVQNADVKIQMQRHAFGFGNVVNAQLLGGQEQSFPYTRNRGGIKKISTWQDAQKYREVVKEYFNYVTFESELRPHVWKQMRGGSERGKKMHDVFANRAVPWLQSHDIGIRGHYIAWGAIDYNAAEKQFVGKPEAHRQWLWSHMADVLPETADYVAEWDTINHIIGWGKHTYEKEYGGFDIYTDIMKEARRLAPAANHSINEGKVLPDGYKREPYKRVIRFLNECGQSPDTVGFMAHFELTSLTPPEELLAVYDDFGQIAPNMQLSELDVETGDDEQLQADFYRDVLIATFSHPNFTSIVQWGFWENAHWKPAAALWRADWSLKPSGLVFVDLVKKQWWTNETATTDAGGRCQTRGFLGDYQVSVRHNGQTVTEKIVLDREGARIQIQVD